MKLGDGADFKLGDCVYRLGPNDAIIQFVAVVGEFEVKWVGEFELLFRVDGLCGVDLKRLYSTPEGAIRQTVLDIDTHIEALTARKRRLVRAAEALRGAEGR